MSKKSWIIAAVLSISAYAWAEDPYEVAWISQIGTGSDDYSYSVAVDASGNAYISGYTWADLDGPNAGPNDVFLSKFDPNGNEVWTTQIGTSNDDQSYGVALDASGNAYVSGHTGGDLGGANAGYRDAFLVKYEVPEPATMSLLALGGLTMLRRKKQ